MFASVMGALLLQNFYGNYDLERHKIGFLTENKHARLDQIIPTAMTKQLKPKKWESMIYHHYRSLKGLDKHSTKVR